MTRQEAISLLGDYAAGELPGQARTEIERLAASDSELAALIGSFMALEGTLRSQTWQTASDCFTEQVLARVGRLDANPVPTALWIWDVAKTWSPLAAAATLVVLYGHLLSDLGGEMFRAAGGWLGSMTGMSAFAIHPILLLAILAPLAAGALASCILSGRCRITA